MLQHPNGPELNARKAQWRKYIAENAAQGHPLSIGLAASFTVEPVIPYLGASLIDLGFAPEITAAPFGQVHQTCLDPASAFHPATPDCIIMLWRCEDILAPELAAWIQGDDTALSRAQDRIDELIALVGTLASNHSGPVIVSNAPYPILPQAAITDLDAVQQLAVFHNQINTQWHQQIAQPKNIYLLDLDGLQRTHGIAHSADLRKWHLYRQPYTEPFLHAIASQISRILNAIHRPAKKCIALDCDNTLWGGVIGEDGLSGIELGKDYPGSAFQDFQKLLLHLKNQGTLLTLLSKNNEQDVWDAFDRHDEMVLKREDIAAWRVDWNPKSENITELAKELNIGLDSFVFIDDNPFEIEQMRAAHPDVVECLQVPEETVDIIPQLKATCWFDRIHISEEDRARTDMIRSERERRPLEQSLTHEDFIASLELQITLFRAQPDHLGRVTQLINKTNQFNLTTIRRTEDEVRSLHDSPDYHIFAARVQDRFGDYGITGVVILHTSNTVCTIDTFLLSCRVLGRGVETALLAGIAQLATIQSAKEIQSRFIPTEKNAPAASFLPDHGFVKSGDVFILNPVNYSKKPSAVQIRITQ